MHGATIKIVTITFACLMAVAMCMIKAQVAEQLKTYRHERVTERSSVTDKEK
jgi:hypothetical protein